MGVQDAPYSLRLDRESMQKIRALAEKDKRSVNMQLCVAIEYYLEEYEAKNGPIPLPKDTAR